jgi:thymidylate synthase (FAD)
MVIEVNYVDHCGSDLTTVNAARVSFGKRSEYEEGACGEWSLSESDKKLIHYLAEHKHYSPFGHAFASFHVSAPVFVRAQLVKHEYLRVNEVSRRYVDSSPTLYNPIVWRGRAEDKKQGSSNEYVTDLRMQGHGMQTVHDAVFKHHMHSLDLYRDMITAGIAPEMARMVLPQSMMTEWYWSGSLDAFANMCNLRLPEDSQYESRLVAQQISDKMLELYPVSWKALVEL